MVSLIAGSLDITVTINISQEKKEYFRRENFKSNKFVLIPQKCIREK